ncbi:MAG TPA: hypothetical protein VK875_05500 [Euzebyales bacterium]|nr:hypothetical protein [Euzebyales bacterium]
MAIHQCPRCELRFRTEAEYHDHLQREHGVDPTRLAPFRYDRAREQKPLYPDLVEGVDHERHQVLILANATLRAERLQEHLRRQADAADTLFLLVVPAVATDPQPRESSFATVGRPVHTREHSLSGEMLAEHRLNEALPRLAQAGLQIEGMVGDADPLRAAEEALRRFQADEIVLSTLPQSSSRWLEVDLPSELRRRFGIPVTVVSAA